MKTVESQVFTLSEVFAKKYTVDFYQRDYVWQTKQIEDLISDLSNEFLKNWKKDDSLIAVNAYDPYYMGEIVLSLNDEKTAIIDGQQRITSLTLLLIFLIRKYGHLKQFPESIKSLVYSDYFGSKQFNLDIDNRRECMSNLLNNGEYIVKDSDDISVKNLVQRYSDIEGCWNDNINEINAVSFAYWVKEKIVFSKVWTNNDDFAYVIFETMNDRGLSLTQLEMLRSYILANIDDKDRKSAMNKFDSITAKLIQIKLSSKSKAEFEFFKVYFRSHLAEDFSQSKNSNSDFVRIGKEFHRWFREKAESLDLISSEDFMAFIDKLVYFSDVYKKICDKIQTRDSKNYLYLIVNSDYNFTLQPALILSSIAYNDSEEIIDKKIKIVSKYLTKILTWKTWNHQLISQSSMEDPVYKLCKDIRNTKYEDLLIKLNEDPLDHPELENAPILNQQIKPRLKVMLSLITEIVGRESGESDYLMNHGDMQVEHIWSDHFEDHKDEFSELSDFSNMRNTIGDLLVLPSSFNESYNDDPYESKVKQYFSQNILAQTLNSHKYTNNPGFIKFKEYSKLPFVSYEHFKKSSINERSELYKKILLWDFSKLD